MIYVIRDIVSGSFKIGYAADPEKRIDVLQTGNPSPLELVKVIHGERQREVEIHRELREFRLRGEWFSPSPDVIAFIERMGEVEYETHEGVQYLVLRHIGGITDFCPFCGRKHQHGDADGHRLSHCDRNKTMRVVARDGTVLEADRGYVLVSRKVNE